MTEQTLKEFETELLQLRADSQKTSAEIDSLMWSYAFSFLSPDDTESVALKARWEELQAERSAQNAKFTKLTDRIDNLEKID
jgi:chromosome segregation ATPase